jgi:hypothetical protein
VDSHRTYAMSDGPALVEIRIHPHFVDWAGQDYAVVAHADDPNPTRPAWAVIAATDLVGPWPETTGKTSTTT